MLLKFYNYYVTNEYFYEKEGRIIEKMSLDDYMELIFPVMDSICEDVDLNVKNIGVTAREVHHGLIRYLREV